MAKWIRTLLPALCGLVLLLTLPENTFAQDPPPLPSCSMCFSHSEYPGGVCLPDEWGATGCTYANGGRCELTGNVCNPAQALALPAEDRLVIPTDGGTVVVARLEGNTFGGWACNGELNTAYRDVGNGVVVELSPAEFAPYRSRYSFDAYREVLATRSRHASG